MAAKETPKPLTTRRYRASHVSCSYVINCDVYQCYVRTGENPKSTSMKRVKQHLDHIHHGYNCWEPVRKFLDQINTAAWNMSGCRFLLTPIFPYIDRIFVSVLIQKNPGQEIPGFSVVSYSCNWFYFKFQESITETIAVKRNPTTYTSLAQIWQQGH